MSVNKLQRLLLYAAAVQGNVKSYSQRRNRHGRSFDAERIRTEGER